MIPAIIILTTIRKTIDTSEGGAKKKVIDTIPKILKIKVQVNPPPPPPPPPTNTPILDHAPLKIIT